MNALNRQYALDRECLYDHFSNPVPHNPDVADLLFRETIYLANRVQDEGGRKGLIILATEKPVLDSVHSLIDQPSQGIDIDLLGDRRSVRQTLYDQASLDSALLVVGTKITGMGVPLVDYSVLDTYTRQQLVPPSWRPHKRHSTAFINSYLGHVITMSEESGTVRHFHRGEILRTYESRPQKKETEVTPIIVPEQKPTGTGGLIQKIGTVMLGYLF